MTSVPTETLKFLMIFFAVSAGVAFLALLSRESGVARKRWFRVAVAVAAWLILSGVGVLLYTQDQLAGGVVSMVVGFFFLYFVLGAECQWGRQVFAWACIASLAGAVLGGVLHSRELELLQKDLAREDQREHELKEFGKIARQERPQWTAEAGVGEAAAGSLVAWVTVDPQILIDAEHEGWLGRQCAREVPIHLILLNNSYRTLSIALDQQSFWQVQILDAASGVLRQWDFKPGESTVTFLPAGREGFEITWDGRDKDGTLLGPGSYAVRFRVRGNGPSGELSQGRAAFEIIEAGPEVIVEYQPGTGDSDEELMERIQREQDTIYRWDWSRRLMPSL